MALRDMTLVSIPFIRAVIRVSGTEAGVVPSVHLLQPPNLKDVCAAVADRNRARCVLDFSHAPAGVVPVVDERPVRADPLFFSALWVRAALCVAQIIFHQRLWRTR